MRRAVLRSYADWTSYDGIPRDEFTLDPKAAEETTLYEADFLLSGDGPAVRWTYGFELGARRVEAEWLFAYPKGRRQVWFERDASREKDFEFPGERLHDRARLARATRPDALLLTRAANDGHEQLTPVFDWFKDNLWDVIPETERAQREDYTAIQFLRSPDFRRRAKELLRVADLGIADAEVEQSKSGRPVVVPGGGPASYEHSCTPPPASSRASRTSSSRPPPPPRRTPGAVPRSPRPRHRCRDPRPPQVPAEAAPDRRPQAGRPGPSLPRRTRTAHAAAGVGARAGRDRRRADGDPRSPDRHAGRGGGLMGGERTQVRRVPSKPVRRDGDGSIAVDLWVSQEGAYDSDVVLRLSPAEAEMLHAQLCRALDDETAVLVVPESSRPECRKNTRTRGTR
ncbi:AAA family ATPase [Streptomyces acidiscabies]|uniref:AAA family ATPase n=1 Tax=Streptomyces acidiscabies TaxID=42234 RepID=UPI0038F6F615